MDKTLCNDGVATRERPGSLKGFQRATPFGRRRLSPELTAQPAKKDGPPGRAVEKTQQSGA
jgi:hypothetical protein